MEAKDCFKSCCLFQKIGFIPIPTSCSKNKLFWTHMLWMKSAGCPGLANKSYALTLFRKGMKENQTRQRKYEHCPQKFSVFVEISQTSLQGAVLLCMNKTGSFFFPYYSLNHQVSLVLTAFQGCNLLKIYKRIKFRAFHCNTSVDIWGNSSLFCSEREKFHFPIWFVNNRFVLFFLKWCFFCDRDRLKKLWLLTSSSCLVSL